MMDILLGILAMLLILAGLWVLVMLALTKGRR